MMNEFEHIDDLVAKVLAGEASDKEKAYLNDWSSASEENRIYVMDAKQLFEQIDSMKEYQPVDVNAAWAKVNDRIEGKETKVIDLPKRNRSLMIAASLALLIGLTFLYKLLVHTTKEEPLIYAAGNEIVEKNLPDGSKITMNKNTKLSYVVNAENVREVKLEGEAYFEVVHNEKQPFMIDMDGVKIKDIGTEFNVKALPGSDVIEVKVKEGEVQFFTQDNEGLQLGQGEKALYKKLTKQFTKTATDPSDNTGSYHSKLLNFNGKRLQDAIEDLNALCGCNVRLGNPNLGNCRITVSFNLKAQTPEEVIEVIAEIMDLKVEKINGAFVLNGDNCPNI
jgi:ferric-dicitrate binding protein FerR (iron transport regulator)